MKNKRKVNTKIIIGSIVLIIIVSIVVKFYSNVNQEIKNLDNGSEKIGPKLMLIGMDGADWNIINPLILAGKMPNLEHLIDNGVSATPKTLNPTISPAIWTTVATGKLPNKHGIQNFLSTAHDYEFRFVGSDSRKSKAIWNILSDAGEKIGLFGYWATWPPEKINGYIVSDLAALDPQEGIYPDSLKSVIMTEGLKTLGFNALQGGFNLTLPDPKSPDDEEFFEVAKKKLSDLDEIFRATSLKAFDSQKVDSQIQITGVLDAAQHLFLKFHWPDKYPEKIPEKLLKKYSSFLEELYINQDEYLGEIIKRAGPNTHIIVLSDHGVFIDPATGYRFKQFNTILSQLGYLTYDATGNIDFTKTTAFECNNNTFDWQRRLCINVKGKYSGGVVEQKDFQKVKARIIKSLETVKTPGGESMFGYVRNSTESNSDIQYDIKRTLIGKLIIVNGVYRTFNEYLNLSIESGNHYANPEGPNGIFIWKGPNIKKNYTLDINYPDILPNILTAFGLPIGHDMDGDFIEDLFINPPTPKYIETYEDGLRSISASLLESIEEADGINIENDKVYLQSEISSDDTYDNFCFTVPNIENYALINNLGESTEKTGINFLGHDNPEISQQLDISHFQKLSDLPKFDSEIIPFDKLIFPEDKKSTYNILTDLEVNRPTRIGLWTNTRFSFTAPHDGILRIVASSTIYKKQGPVLNIVSGSLKESITIDSKNFKTYELPIKKGLVTISYENDDKDAKEDRNVYIQNLILFGADTKEQLNSEEFFRMNHSFCIQNTKPGTTELSFQLQDLNSILQTTEGLEALELLETTGEID